MARNADSTSMVLLGLVAVVAVVAIAVLVLQAQQRTERYASEGNIPIIAQGDTAGNALDIDCGLLRSYIVEQGRANGKVSRGMANLYNDNC